MANEIVSGTCRPVEPRRVKRGYSLFDEVVIEDDGGKQRVVKKVSAAGEVAEAVRRGGKGRFFLSTYGGQTGIHGVHMADGTRAYRHYNNLETVLMIGIGAGLIMLVIGLAGIDGFMITPVLIGAVLVIFYFYVRSKRLAAKKQYDSTP